MNKNYDDDDDNLIKIFQRTIRIMTNLNKQKKYNCSIYQDQIFNVINNDNNPLTYIVIITGLNLYYKISLDCFLENFNENGLKNYIDKKTDPYGNKYAKPIKNYKKFKGKKISIKSNEAKEAIKMASIINTGYRSKYLITWNNKNIRIWSIDPSNPDKNIKKLKVLSFKDFLKINAEVLK